MFRYTKWIGSMGSNKDNFRFPMVLRRYYIVGVALLTILFAFLIFRYSKSTIISAREEFAISIANDINSSVDWNSPSYLAELDKITKKYLSFSQVKSINVIDINKRVVYSSNTNLINKLFKDDDQLKNALSGKNISTLNAPNNRIDEDLDESVRVLETYVPFNFGNSQDINLVFRIEQHGELLKQQIQRAGYTILAGSIVMFFLFVLYFRFAFGKCNHTQAKLSEEKNKLQVILNHVPSAFILVDKDFRIQSSSAALREFSGENLTNINNFHCYDIICKKKKLLGSCPSRKALKTNQIESSSLVYRNNGDERYLEHTAIPISNNGQIDSILEIITDITDKKKMQESIIQTEKLSAVGQVAATIAHEIRNGLTSVKLILQHLSDSLYKDRNKKAANVALESIDEMENVVKQLLDFARPTPVYFKFSDVNKLAKHSVDFCRQQIELKCLNLAEEYCDDVPKLRLDTEHMRVAIVNLLLNAIQVSDKNGLLRIMTSVACLEENKSDYFIEKKADIHLKKDQRVVKIEITDNGYGIPDANLDQIFDPFFTTKIDGSGLGLSVTRRTVHEHGGIITVESQQGIGSTFTMILPIEMKRHEEQPA